MAHSHIWPCGKSNDAMLAARVYSVIKEKKGVVKSLFPWVSRLEKTSLYPCEGLIHRCKTCQNKGMRLCNRLSWVEKNVFNSSQEWITNDCQKHTQNPEEITKAALCSPPPSPCSFLPSDSTLLPGPRKAISRSHTWTYINVTTNQRTQQACLWDTCGPPWHFPVQL